MSDDQLQESLLPSDRADLAVENRPLKPKPFRRSFTIIFAILAVTLTIFRGLPFLTENRLTLLYYPDTTVLWMVEQNMYLHKALDEPSLAKVLSAVFAFHRDGLIDVSEKGLRDVISFLERNHLRTSDKIQTLRANLIMVLCEANRFSEARVELGRLGEGKDVQDFKRAIEAVYFPKFLLINLDADKSARILEDGWASSQLRARIAILLQNRDAIYETEWWVQQQAQHWMDRLVLISIVTLGLFAVGICFFVTVLIPKYKIGVFDQEKEMAPWSAEESYGIIARAVCCGTVLYFLFPKLGQNLQLLLCWNALVIWGPTVLWFYYRICKPRGKSITEFFGLSLAQPRLGILVGAGIALFTADWLGIIAIDKILSLTEIEWIWAEGIDEYLMYETWPWRLAIGIEAVIWAPLFEEILFRGLLFTALRKQMNWQWAALISGACFGGVHFYSFTGFLMVTWFGFLMAFAYEKTKSLIPCIIAHALYNLFHVWASIWSTSSSY